MPIQRSLLAHCGSLWLIRINLHLIPRNILHVQAFYAPAQGAPVFVFCFPRPDYYNFVNGPNATVCYIPSNRRNKLSSLCRYMRESEKEKTTEKENGRHIEWELE